MRTLVIAPHPDDEVLGCGGTLLRRGAEGATLGWLIVTAASEAAGWSAAQVRARRSEIDEVRSRLGFAEVFNLALPPARLDTLPIGDLVKRFAEVFKSFEPQEVLMPHRSDSHSDHRVVFDAAAACTKWFRYPSVKRVLAYETLSETDAALDTGAPFRPNVFVDIGEYLDRKVEAMAVYASEVGDFPFPRSAHALRALAAVRGAAAGYAAAEAFELLRERQ